MDLIRCGASVAVTPLDQQGQSRYQLTRLVFRCYFCLWAKPNQLPDVDSCPKCEDIRDVYSSYVDEVVAYRQVAGGVVGQFYSHYNSLYSVAALMDVSGAVMERHSYSAYGSQTITSPGGALRSKSAVGFDRAFTGYIKDEETGLLHARNRMYSSSLGRYMARDPWRRDFYSPTAGDGYVDGFSVYSAWFVPNGLDPFGLEDCWKISQYKHPTGNTDITYPAVRPGFSVEFLDKCKPECCKSVKLLQWIRDDGGRDWHPDGTKDRVTTQPPLPKRSERPWHYYDAPTRFGVTTYNITTCAYCVKDDGTETLISCVYFSFNRRTGDIGVDGGHGPGGAPSNPDDQDHLAPGEQPRPGVPPLNPGVTPPPLLNPGLIGHHGRAF